MGTRLKTVRLYYVTCQIIIVWHSPQNKEELFNLRHSSARNVVERIFGIVKRRFRILLLPAEFSIEIQAQIPSALCAIHNFIYVHDPIEDDESSDSDEADNNEGYAMDDAHNMDDPVNYLAANSDDGARELRDQIAEGMWADYQRILRERSIEENSDSDSEDTWIDELDT